jgi:hypothetical protein
MNQLSETEAYLAMFAFLEGHFSRTQSSDIGALLGELSVLPDGQPADPAVKSDWASAIAQAKTGRVSAQMRLSK